MALPPLISKTAPVEKEFSSLDNHATMEANSLSSKYLFLGTFDNINFQAFKLSKLQWSIGGSLHAFAIGLEGALGIGKNIIFYVF